MAICKHTVTFGAAKTQCMLTKTQPAKNGLIFCYICNYIFIMIRKKTAILFILLANIILLAHAVVPHHHHYGGFYLVSENCQCTCKIHNHDHDGNKCTENCVLKQVDVIQANSTRHEFKCLVCDINHTQAIHFLAVFLSNEFNLFVPEIVQKAQIPLKITTELSFISTSSGFRAPPAA